MNKKLEISNKVLIIFFADVLIVCIAALLIMSYGEKGGVAKIYKNGELIYTVNLNELEDSRIIDLGANTVLAEKGKISMASADCPDKLCVKRGKISDGTFPIVCLPNEIYITVTGGGAYDALVG